MGEGEREIEREREMRIGVLGSTAPRTPQVRIDARHLRGDPRPARRHSVLANQGHLHQRLLHILSGQHLTPSPPSHPPRQLLSVCVCACVRVCVCVCVCACV